MMQVIQRVFHKLKAKRGQSLLEIGICAPVILLFTLGLLDIIKYNIIYMDISYFVKKEVMEFASTPHATYRQFAITNLSADLEKKGIFSYQIVSQNTSLPKNSDKVYVIQAKTPREIAMQEGNKSAGAGAEVCFSFNYSFQPMFPFSGRKTMDGNVTECAIMEYSGYIPG